MPTIVGRVFGWLVLFSLLGLPRPAQGILFYSTGDPAHNTTAPTGTLTNSGWQYEGTWGAFLGTPIAAKYFITAAHVGGAVGDPLYFQGVDYTTTAFFDDTNSDLRIWRICGNFPAYAPLYSRTHEIGKTVVVFGRGTQRGSEVIISSDSTNSLKGWFWGPADGVQRWGTNVVSATVSMDTGLSDPNGVLLKCNFDASGGADESDLSVGDSGGGVFIQDAGVWRLAGINYAVDGPYNTSTNGDGFLAAIFDEGGLYTMDASGMWTLTPDLSTNVPGGFYSSRISARQTWINSVLQSTPADPPPIVQSAESIIGPYAVVPDAVVDTNAKTITAPAPPGMQFYRLRACDPFRISSIMLSGTMVLMSYQ